MKKIPVLTLLFLFIIVILYWGYFKGSDSLFRSKCKAREKFNIYEFEARVIDKYEDDNSKILTLITFEQEPATIDFTTEKNGLFEALAIGDTLIKKSQEMSVFIKNFEKQKNFEVDFYCETDEK